MLGAVAVAFATVFVAELGDKSQLVALTFASRYRPRLVVAGVLTASALVMAASVAVGGALGAYVPRDILSVAGGVLFVLLGLAHLRGRSPAATGDGDAPTTPQRGFAAVVAGTVAAELGDKTMIAALALAATGSTLGVWLGATLGMTAASALAVLAGASVWRRRDPRILRRVSAVLFLLVGAFLIGEPWFA